MSDQQKVAAFIAKAKEGARIELLRMRNRDEGATCFSVGIGGGCGETCPVFLAHDCEHGMPDGAPSDSGRESQ